LSLERAQARVDFAVYDLPGLGPPVAAWVSRDQRVLTLAWDGGIRLDQTSSLTYTFEKTASSWRYVSVGGREALWLGSSHDLVVLDESGTRVPRSLRPAGPTLVWTRGETTLRLEGDLSLTRALAVAQTARRHP
jgi:hypothetical protein